MACKREEIPPVLPDFIIGRWQLIIAGNTEETLGEVNISRTLYREYFSDGTMKDYNTEIAQAYKNWTYEIDPECLYLIAEETEWGRYKYSYKYDVSTELLTLKLIQVEDLILFISYPPYIQIYQRME
jgi:hypothetical protein